MSDTKRLLVVANAFWPILSDESRRLLLLCTTLRRHGVSVTVVTARWDNQLSKTCEIAGIQVHRLMPGPKTSWTESQFAKTVCKWISQRTGEFDVVYCDFPDHVASSVLEQLHGLSAIARPKAVVRFSTSQVLARPSSLNRKFNRLATGLPRAFDAVIVPDSDSARQAHLAFVPAKALHRIPDLVDPNLLRAVEKREDSTEVAFAALFRHSLDFLVPPNTKLILFVNEISVQSGLSFAAKAVGHLVDQEKRILMWATGAWTQIQNMHGFLRDNGWHRQILLHGQFDSLEELFQIADGIIVPEPKSCSGYLMPFLEASGLPAIVSSDYRPDGYKSQSSLPGIYKHGDLEDCIRVLTEWYRDTIDWSDRPKSSRAFSGDQTIQNWFTLFD
jgi:hypothetical protein